MPKTEMKVKYEYKPDWNLSKPIRVDRAGNDIKYLIFEIIVHIRLIIMQYLNRDWNRNRLKRRLRNWMELILLNHY